MRGSAAAKQRAARCRAEVGNKIVGSTSARTFRANTAPFALIRLAALKLLPPEKVADAKRKRRFVREARSASAPNHPNIVTIYDIDCDPCVDFIAME